MADLQKARDALNDLAHTDALTGVLNRRAFMAALDAQMRSSRWPAAVLMVDLDHFKSVNDRFGHGCGDDVLQEVARRCRSAVRVSDAVGRIGGEEFAILMPGCATAQAREAADRVCAAVRAHPVDCSDRTSIPVSASVGGSAAFEVPASGEEWLRRADEALYRSKAAGRDRVSWASG
jgi:diguanylate cyclase (GGDEF)-like protein